MEKKKKKKKQILSPTYLSRCEPKSLKNIAPEPQSIFSKNEKLFLWKRFTKSKTPGLSFSSKKRDFVSLRHLVKKRGSKPELRLCSRKTQSSERDFRVYIEYLKVNKWFCLTHYHLISYWNNYYEHTCTSNQLLDSLQVKPKAYDGFVTSKKRNVEFQPSQWNSTKKWTFELICSFSKVLTNA